MTEQVRQSETLQGAAEYPLKLARLVVELQTGQIVEASEAAAQLFETTRAKLLRGRLQELVKESDADVERALAAAAARQSPSFRCRISVQARERWLEMHWVSWPTEGTSAPEANRICAIVHDATRQSEAEQALKQSEQKRRLLLEVMTEGYLETDLRGNLRFFNESVCEVLGYTRAELQRVQLRDCLDASSQRSVRRQVRRALVGAPSMSVKWRVRHKGGSVRHIVGTVQLIRDESGKPSGFRCFGHDTTQAEIALQALSVSEQRFRDLFDNAPVGYHEIDAQGRYTRVNQTEAKMLGYEQEEMLGRYAWEFVAEKSSKAAVERKLAGEVDLAPFERTFLAKDGSHIPVLVEDRLLKDTRGEACGIRTTVIDISARKRAEAALKDSEARYRQLVELSPDGIVVYRNGRILFVNAAAVRLVGAQRPDQLLGRRALRFVHPASRYRVLELDREIALREVPVPLCEQKLMRLDGSAVDVEVSAMPFASQRGTAIQVVIRDITERKLVEQQIRSLAYHDGLTGLPNRVLFNDRLSVALAQAHRTQQPVGVLFVDLDHFKEINDSLGHSAGDGLLQLVAARLHGCVREGDTLARLGGDEFILLLPGLADSIEAAYMAEKILEELRHPFKVHGRELFVTASIGVSVYPNDGLDVEALVKHSDIAMYRAKEHGRDTYQLYTAGMNARALERLAIEHKLRKALAQDELLVFYQPLVDLQSGQVAGVEALVRWKHPELGLLEPQQFIHIAETTGLILPIGWWVLRTACTQVRAWQLLGYENLSASVNISARQFGQANLVEEVVSALESSGLDPKHLDLEITESCAIKNAEAAARTLKELSDFGVRISIDDFGTGYSSLSYLKRLRINTLKIDRSFVRDIATDLDDAAIAKAIIAMAHSLKLSVVAEGVETTEQLSFFAAHQCDKIQGFYFSRPLPAEECETVLGQAIPLLPRAVGG